MNKQKLIDFINEFVTQQKYFQYHDFESIGNLLTAVSNETTLIPNDLNFTIVTGENAHIECTAWYWQFGYRVILDSDYPSQYEDAEDVANILMKTVEEYEKVGELLAQIKK